ncbi:MAG TPA: 4Fe-4S single cluster domain-containing protein [Bacilli bacterium]|nr:4Fe-4S single cluster domain-containing protein [Bacilli bacterium]
MINLHALTIEDNANLYGPGRRVVIWTQGCSIRCPGCTNEHLWTTKGAIEYEYKEILDFITNQQNIEGITLHGGEPTDQIEVLLPLLYQVRKLELSIILFTGKEIESFKSVKQKEFIGLCDIVKCGPFDARKLNRYLHFRGSTNQRIIHISDRYRHLTFNDGQNTVLLDIDKNGIIVSKGFSDEQMSQLINDYGELVVSEHDSKR